MRTRSPQRPKLALTNVGGRAEFSGDPELARSLSLALAVEPGAGLDRWTHGFHTYAARMHPDTAGRLVRSLSAPGMTVLDPFCGSGTVVLEAFVSGRRALGRDLNPVAIRLAAVRTAVVSDGRRRVLRDRAHRIAGVASGRVRQGHVPPGPRPPGSDLFDSRTFLELSWLRAGIAADREPFVRDALEMVLSSILVKVSCRTSDTDHRAVPRRREPASPARLFGYKVDELCRRWKTLRDALGDDAVPPGLAVDDARRLPSVADASVDLVVTSPPYANVYDYAEQHELRAAWLGLDEGSLRANEVGARRTFRNPKQGLERWEQDGREWVAALARVLRSSGRACILGGDGATELGPVRFDECLARWSSAVGLSVIAAAAQRRPVFDDETRRAFRGSPRREHCILLRKAPLP